MSSLTFGSLFAGIGGFDLGFERAGLICQWQVEIDEYAQKVLAKHWPNVHRKRDIRECGKHNLESVDVICGGFPCQDISYAGRGAGLDGHRSGLFFEAVRVVCELRPRAVVLENVAALLTRGLDQVLGTLAEVGYDAEWHCIPAAAVGAPHIRDRVFVLAYATGERHWQRRESRDVRQTERRPDDELLRKPSGPSQATPDLAYANSSRFKRTGPAQPAERDNETKPIGRGEDVANTRCELREPRPIGESSGDSQAIGCAETEKLERCSSDVSNTNFSRLERQREITSRALKEFRDFCYESWWATEPAVGRVAHGVPFRVDRLKGLGNAVVPQVAEFVGNLVKDRLDVRVQS